MGMEARGSKVYYYRKRREGSRVVSEYVGGGPGAALIARLDAADRAEREEERAEAAARREADRQSDGALDELRAACDALAAAVLLARGCHTHRGEWRRRRDARRVDHRGAE